MTGFSVDREKKDQVIKETSYHWWHLPSTEKPKAINTFKRLILMIGLVALFFLFIFLYICIPGVLAWGERMSLRIGVSIPALLAIALFVSLFAVFFPISRRPKVGSSGATDLQMREAAKLDAALLKHRSCEKASIHEGVLYHSFCYEQGSSVAFQYTIPLCSISSMFYEIHSRAIILRGAFMKTVCGNSTQSEVVPVDQIVIFDYFNPSLLRALTDEGALLTAMYIQTLVENKRTSLNRWVYHRIDMTGRSLPDNLDYSTLVSKIV